MKRAVILFLSVLLLMTIAFVNADTDVGVCSTLSIENEVYVLNQSVSGTDCFEITANNVTLDLNGFNISGSNSGYGVFIDGSDNATVRNGIIDNYVWGIKMSSSDSGDIRNITCNNTYYGMGIYSCDYNSIINTTASGQMYGYYVNDSEYNNFENNTAIAEFQWGSPVTYYGFWIYLSPNNNFTNNIANYNYADGIIIYHSNNCVLNDNTANSNLYGIQLSDSNNSILDGNTANSNRDSGIYLAGSYYNNISNSITNSNYGSYNGHGIRVMTGSSNNIFENTTANSNKYIGIELSQSSNYNTFINTSIYNSSTKSVYVYESENNLFQLGTLNLSTDGVYLKAEHADTHSRNNIFKDLFISDTSNYGVYFYTHLTNSYNNTFLNCTYDNEYVTTLSSLIREWYFEAQVNASANGDPIEGALTSGYNVSNALIDSGLTDSDGLAVLELIEYTKTGSTAVYYSNYTINVTKTGWNSNSTSYNLTGNVKKNFLLSQIQQNQPLPYIPQKKFITPPMKVYHSIIQQRTVGLAWTRVGSMFKTPQVALKWKIQR